MKNMLIIKTPKKEIPDEGTHLAKIVEVKDLGLVQTNDGMKEKVLLTVEVAQTDGEGKPRRAFRRATKTLHAKGTLYKIIRAAGEDPGDEFDLAKLIGRKVQIVIEHQKREGFTYGNITTFMRAKSTEPPSGASTPVVRPSGPRPIRPQSSGSAEVLPDDIPESDHEGNVTAGATPTTPA